MADSLCGPSNALQNFQKHSTVDRSLQQDRLVARQSPSQGFRSSQANGSQLEPEFQTFQQGNFPLESQHGFQQQPHFSNASSSLQQPGSAAWASDFQRMHITSPKSQEQYRSGVNGGPVQRQDTGGWHQDFARQFGAEQRVMAQTSQMGASSAYGYSPMNRGMAMGIQSQYGGGMMGQQNDQQHLQEQQPVEAFDEEAFAKAFEEASKLEMGNSEDLQEKSSTGLEMGQDVMIEESAERFMSEALEPTTESQVPEQARLGADLIHDPRAEDQEPQPEDPDALARTAGQLLTSVQNNQTSKFQNSEFLELMRQLRDREVKVNGDDIVGTAEGGQGENAKNEIQTLLQSLRRLVFDRDKSLARNAHEQLRKALLILLYLSRSAHLSERTISHEVERTIQAVVSSPAFARSPAIRGLAAYTLDAFESAERANSNIPSTPLSPELASICLANAEITSILPASESAIETLIYNYISDSLSKGHTWTELQNQEPLNRLLGYEFVDREHGDHPRLVNYFDTPGPQNVHLQRAQEILGPVITETIDACSGFWGSKLSVQDFFALAAAHQAHGGTQSLEFNKLLREVEREVEKELIAEQARNEYTYRRHLEVAGPADTTEQIFQSVEYETELTSVEHRLWRLRERRNDREGKNEVIWPVRWEIQ